MKRKILLATAALALVGSAILPQIASRAQSIDVPTKHSKEKDAEMASKIRTLTRQSTAGRVQKKLKKGGYELDLQDRFQSVPLAKIEMDGDAAVGCVTSLPEANGFFGRDLETGTAMSTYEYDDRGDSGHIMTATEAEFFRNLIAQATGETLNSPAGATLTIVNSDGAGEGFNDLTPKVPEGGNDGATLGQQRLNLFNFAAAIWGVYLDSTVPIKVNAEFNPLTPCSPSGGVLGSAGATGGYRDFAGAPHPGTWYHTALASKLSGQDVNPSTNDINTRFNSSVDTGCLGTGTRFYYGLDNSRPAGTVNLLVVLLHEMGHGLGFASFANGATGAMAQGLPDAYTRNMIDRTTGKRWTEMTDAERVASALNAGNLMWDGPNVRIGSGALSLGRDAESGNVQLYAPTTFAGGSSVSHWDTASTPNLLMEPNISTGLPLDLDLTRQQMRDIGWFRDSDGDRQPDTITSVAPSGSVANFGSTIDITWTNNGGFGRNVTIEMSTDGGMTFPTTVATNVANTGSYSYVVPELSTTQARFRIREAGYAAPISSSTANVTFQSAPSVRFGTVSGAILGPNGLGIRNVAVVLDNLDAQTSRSVFTDNFGGYTFADIPTGVRHSVKVRSKRYNFTSRPLLITGNLAGFDIIGSQ